MEYFAVLSISLLLLLAIRCMSSWHPADIDAKKRSSKYRYPPGPRALPFIGVAHLIPSVFPGEITSKWAQQYGDLMTVQLGGMRWIFCNSTRTARELLERRSAVILDSTTTYARRSLVQGPHGHYCKVFFQMGNGMIYSYLLITDSEWFSWSTTRNGATFERSCINF